MTRAMAWVGVKDGGGVEVSSAAAKTLRFGRPILGSLNNGLTSRGFWVGKIAIGLDQDVFALELELFCSSVGLGKKKLYSEPGPEPEKHLYGGVLNPRRNRQAKDDLPFTFTFSAALHHAPRCSAAPAEDLTPHTVNSYQERMFLNVYCQWQTPQTLAQSVRSLIFNEGLTTNGVWLVLPHSIPRFS